MKHRMKNTTILERSTKTSIYYLWTGHIWFPFIIFIASVSSVITSLCHYWQTHLVYDWTNAKCSALFMLAWSRKPHWLHRTTMNVKWHHIDVQTDLQKHHPTLVNQGDIFKDPDGDLRCSFHLLHISWTDTQFNYHYSLCTVINITVFLNGKADKRGANIQTCL